MRAGVIGLGKLGLPAAEEMAKHHDVCGFDVVPVTSETIRICGNLQELVSNSDLIFIAVQTPHDPAYDGSRPSSHLDNRDFDYSRVAQVLSDLDGLVSSDHTVVLISTVLPGTIRRSLSTCLTRAQLIYNPYLIAMGTVANDMVNPEMIMIGNSSGSLDGSINTLVSFYGPLMKNNPRIVTGTWEEMECTKIFYNTFISAKLGIVNMIQDVAEKIGHTDVDVVAKALADSTQRIMSPAYMKPGMGDGGPCHPRDNIALRWLAQDIGLGYDLFDAIMRAREVQAENLARELVRHGLPVVILGKSFKPGVTYTDGSYGVLVGHYVEEMGGALSYDTITNGPATYLLGHNISYETCEFPHGSVIVDPWRRLTDRAGITIIGYGNTRHRPSTRP